MRFWGSALIMNMFTLIGLGVGVAWIYSAVATVAPGLFPASFRGEDRRQPHDRRGRGVVGAWRHAMQRAATGGSGAFELPWEPQAPRQGGGR